MMQKPTKTDPFIESVSPTITTLLRSPPGKQPVAVGTALLVETNGGYFVVSAAHVLDEGNKLWFFPNAKGPRPIAGEGMLSRPLGQKKHPDRLDVGAIRLSHDPLPPYKDWKAVNVSTLRALAYPRPKVSLAFVGYASSQVRFNPVKKRINRKWIALNGIEIESADVYAEMGLDPSSHLVFKLNRAPIKATDSTTWQFPDPHGLSGSPVWATDEQGPCIVGIVTEYHKDRGVIVATDIRHVLPLIEQAHLNYLTTKTEMQHVLAPTVVNS
jgi:hypothetical protein